MARLNEIYIDDKGNDISLKEIAKIKKIGYVTLFYRYKKLKDELGKDPNFEQVCARPRQGRPPYYSD
jgi:hypothetical protein